MTHNKLPFLHRNARSRQTTTDEVREVFSEEITRGLDFRHISREEYLKKVLP